MVSHHMSMLTAPSTFDRRIGLIGPRPAPPRMRLLIEQELGAQGLECLTSREARISDCATCCTKDVVLVSSTDYKTCDAGQVWFHASYGGEYVSLVSLWSRISWDTDSATCEWREADNPVLMPMEDLLAAVTYTPVSYTHLTLPTKRIV